LGMLEERWTVLLDRARAHARPVWSESVDGEWSLLQTLRHLVFAIDKWFTVPILGGSFSALGLPNSGSVDFPWPGLDGDAQPSLDEVLEIRSGRVALVRDFLASVSVDALAGTVDVLENGPHSTLDCIHVVFEEEFWHLRYATRDLESMEARD
jgi:DinB superfamily